MIDSAGSCQPATSTSSHACAAPPAPSSTQALFEKLPASMSACVTVCVAVQVIDAPGANDEPLAGVQPDPLDIRVGHRHRRQRGVPVVGRRDRVVDHVTDRVVARLRGVLQDRQRGFLSPPAS